MKIRMKNRAWIAALVAALTVAGCSTAKQLSKPQPAGASDPPKQYDWKDMSTGKSNFRPITPASQD
jgi:hypothetical protein